MTSGPGLATLNVYKQPTDETGEQTMRSLNELVNRNDRATMREYNDAIESGNVTLAGRIALANPDLFPGRTPTMRVQSQIECRVIGPHGHIFPGPSYARRACVCGQPFPKVAKS